MQVPSSVDQILQVQGLDRDFGGEMDGKHTDS